MPRLQGLCWLTTRAQAAGHVDMQTHTQQPEGRHQHPCLLCIVTCPFATIMLFEAGSLTKCHAFIDHQHRKIHQLPTSRTGRISSANAAISRTGRAFVEYTGNTSPYSY